MATKKLKVDASVKNFTLSSKWKGSRKFVYYGSQSYGYYEYKFTTGPTTSNKTVTFSYSLPSGAKIKSATVWAKFNSPNTGCSVRKVNGNAFSKKSGSKSGATVKLTKKSGTFSAKFSFKANGNKKDLSEKTATLQVQDVYLQIEYEVKAQASTSTSSSNNKGGFSVPPQSVAVYNQDNGKIYLFDGVLKIQHNFSVKLEEEPEKKKNEYVNNARNEPDKVTIDVMMSDVYSDSGALTVASSWDETAQKTAYNKTKNNIIPMQSNGAWSRSANAAHTLHKIKEARKKVSVITPHYIHANMIISSIVINQDDSTPYGWQGQIEFQHAFKKSKKKKNNSSKPKAKKQPVGDSVWGGMANNKKNAGRNTVKNMTK